MRSCHCTLAGTMACKTCPNNNDYEMTVTNPITDGYVYVDPKDYGREAVESYQDQLVSKIEEERARIARHYRISEHADDAGYLNALDWLIALIRQEGKWDI